MHLNQSFSLNGHLLTTLTFPRKAPREDAMRPITRSCRGHERHQTKTRDSICKMTLLFYALAMGAHQLRPWRAVVDRPQVDSSSGFRHEFRCSTALGSNEI